MSTRIDPHARDRTFRPGRLCPVNGTIVPAPPGRSVRRQTFTRTQESQRDALQGQLDSLSIAHADLKLGRSDGRDSIDWREGYNSEALVSNLRLVLTNCRLSNDAFAADGERLVRDWGVPDGGMQFVDAHVHAVSSTSTSTHPLHLLAPNRSYNAQESARSVSAMLPMSTVRST